MDHKDSHLVHNALLESQLMVFGGVVETRSGLVGGSRADLVGRRV